VPGTSWESTPRRTLSKVLVEVFLLSQGVFKNLAFPGAIRTSPEGVNAKGQVVGIYIDKGGNSHGFQLKGTTYASIDFPGSVLTYANSINQSGVIVGEYFDGARYHGFMLQGTQFTTIDYQPAVGNAAGSVATNINDKGQIVGIYSLTDSKLNSGQHGYLQTGSIYSIIDFPNASQTGCEGINNSGQVVGGYVDHAGISHGFTLISAAYTTLDFPGATISSPIGINDSGQIVGWYATGNAGADGFLATPVPGTTSLAPGPFGRVIR